MTESGFRPTGTPDLAVAKSHNDFAMLEPREQLATLLKEHVVGRPFSELAAVTFDHRAATVMGHGLRCCWCLDRSICAHGVCHDPGRRLSWRGPRWIRDGLRLPVHQGPLHRRPPCGAVGCLAVRKVVRADQLAGHPAQRQ